jgi:mannose-6-phosphate isomerase-like protein (cupin superfamily)
MRKKMSLKTSVDAALLVRVPGVGAPARIRRFETLVQVRSEATGGAVAMLEHRLGIGALAMPLHRHAPAEVVHVLAGTLHVQLGDVVRQLDTGESVAIPGGMWHTFWVGPDEHEAARFLSVVTPGGLERYYEAVAAHVGPTGLPDIEPILAAGDKHGVEVQMESIYDLVERHTIQLA